MSEQIISASKIDIYRERIPILTNISFNIKAGEFCYLLGRTGTGKSSLLHTLFALERPRAGKLSVNGYDLNSIVRSEIPMYRRTLGMVFQDYRLFDDLTAGENLDIILKATGWKNKKRRLHRIRDVMKMLGLEAKIDLKPYQLSGGEKQRIAIGRAILNSPKLILGDEPTGNLDPDTTNEIMFLLRRLNRELGAAVLIATHDYRILDKFPGHIFHIQNGGLQKV